MLNAPKVYPPLEGAQVRSTNFLRKYLTPMKCSRGAQVGFALHWAGGVKVDWPVKSVPMMLSHISPAKID